MEYRPEFDPDCFDEDEDDYFELTPDLLVLIISIVLILGFGSIIFLRSVGC